MNVRAEDLMLSNHGVREEMEWTPWRSNQSIIKEINPEYLTYMQSILCEMPGWMKLKLKSRLLGAISTASYMEMIPL